MIKLNRRNFCQCSCHGIAKPGNRYILGHHRRVHPILIPNHHPCECPCGELVASNRRFVRGHQNRGRFPGNKGKKGGIPWNKGLILVPRIDKTSEEYLRKRAENETIRCQGISKTMKQRTLEEGNNNPRWGRSGELNLFYGKKHTVESNEKNRQSHLGRKHADETKEKQSKSRIFFVSQMSKEEKKKQGQKISAAKKGMVFTLEHRKALSVAQKIYFRNLYGEIERDYPEGFNDIIKELIRYRDGYKCQNCGISQEEHDKKLAVHHIDYIKTNIDECNLISLCSKCHSKTNRGENRPRWKEYFHSKMLTINESLLDVYDKCVNV